MCLSSLAYEVLAVQLYIFLLISSASRNHFIPIRPRPEVTWSCGLQQSVIFQSNYVIGLSNIKMSKAYSLSICFCCLLMSYISSQYLFFSISISNQNLDMLIYDPLSLIKFEEEQVTDAEVLLDESHDLVRQSLCEALCLISMKTKVGQFTWHTPVLPQQCETLEFSTSQWQLWLNFLFILPTNWWFFLLS